MLRKMGRPTQLRKEIAKALEDDRLSPKQRLELVNMLAEVDGYVFKFRQAKSVEELPTKEDVYAQDSEARIKKALGGVKEETCRHQHQS